MAELELVVDEVDARLREQRLQHRVDPMRERLHLRDLVRRRPPQHADVVVVDERIVQRVALQEELEDRLGQSRALLDAVALGHRARADVAHDALDRDHLHRLDQRLALVQQRDEMRADPRGGELAHHVRVDPVVRLALAFELRELDAVERRHVVAVVHDEPVRIVGRVHGLRLAAIQLLPLFHACAPGRSRSRYIVAPAEAVGLVGDADPVGRAAERAARAPRAPCPACCSAATDARR